MIDYKEKYEAALEQARKELKTCGSMDCDAARQIFRFFPELRESEESEDERVRKEIVSIVKAYRENCIDEGTHRFDDCLSWLEKQKDPEDIIGKAMSYFGAESLLDNANGLSDFEKFTAWLYCEFLRGLPKKLNQEYIKEQTKVILDAAQKELCKMPNSTELIEMWDAEKAMLQEKDFRGDTWRIAQNAFMDGFARGTCVKFEKQKEQKPAEWSEEDKNTYKWVYNLFERSNDKWFECVFAGCYPKVKRESVLSWLKSLRPHWRPSEEQMDRLFSIVAALRKDYCDDMADFLANLYTDLNKLKEGVASMNKEIDE